jgi:putative two-component system response regulator
VSNRILIVDDNPDDVAMLEAFLDGEASSIRAETQSRHAEAAIAEFDPDLVLLDLHMPEPDGMEILRRIRGVRQSAGFLPVIVITGEDNAPARNNALVLGADDFLSKPLDRQEVVLRVRNLLRTRRLYVELANTNSALKKRLGAPGRTPQT